MRSDERFRPMPVTVLTTSKAESEILSSYQLGANCFITKPVQLAELLEVIHSIEDFWLTLVGLPSA
jgi:chemotaxis family two-component system response regulator Rcp1